MEIVRGDAKGGDVQGEVHAEHQREVVIHAAVAVEGCPRSVEGAGRAGESNCAADGDIVVVVLRPGGGDVGAEGRAAPNIRGQRGKRHAVTDGGGKGGCPGGGHLQGVVLGQFAVDAPVKGDIGRAGGDDGVVVEHDAVIVNLGACRGDDYGSGTAERGRTAGVGGDLVEGEHPADILLERPVVDDVQGEAAGSHHRVGIDRAEEPDAAGSGLGDGQIGPEGDVVVEIGAVGAVQLERVRVEDGVAGRHVRDQVQLTEGVGIADGAAEGGRSIRVDGETLLLSGGAVHRAAESDVGAQQGRVVRDGDRAGVGLVAGGGNLETAGGIEGGRTGDHEGSERLATAHDVSAAVAEGGVAGDGEGARHDHVGIDRAIEGDGRPREVHIGVKPDGVIVGLGSQGGDVVVDDGGSAAAGGEVADAAEVDGCARQGGVGGKVEAEVIISARAADADGEGPVLTGKGNVAGDGDRVVEGHGGSRAHRDAGGHAIDADGGGAHAVGGEASESLRDAHIAAEGGGARGIYNEGLHAGGVGVDRLGEGDIAGAGVGCDVGAQDDGAQVVLAAAGGHDIAAKGNGPAIEAGGGERRDPADGAAKAGVARARIHSQGMGAGRAVIHGAVEDDVAGARARRNGKAAADGDVVAEADVLVVGGDGGVEGDAAGGRVNVHGIDTGDRAADGDGGCGDIDIAAAGDDAGAVADEGPRQGHAARCASLEVAGS